MKYPKHFHSAVWVRFLVLATIGSISTVVFAADGKVSRDAAQKKMNEGNFKDAFDAFRKLALDPADAPAQVGGDLSQGVVCLQNLARSDEIDDFRESVIKVHSKNWRLLQAAAQTYLNGESYGFIIAGKFSRGQHRGGDRAVNCYERDRVRALQLMTQAVPLVNNDVNKNDAAQFYLSLASMFLGNRGTAEAWRLQYLSDLSKLPDYDEGWNFFDNALGGAPVGEDGRPVFHSIPKNFEAAKSDGQRWRWCLLQAVESSPQLRNQVRWQLADFCHQQFGEQTLAYYGWYFGRQHDDDTKTDESGTYALDTLKETETIARLATGIKRFDLPDEFNYIKIYQQIVADPKTGMGPEAADQLAQIMANRRQYPAAVEYWKKAIQQFGPGQDNYRRRQVDQIVKNWCRFETARSQPAGQGATIEFRFRNASKVRFEAHEIKLRLLLDDVKAHLKGNPKEIDWNKINIGDVGYRIVSQNQAKYQGDKVANWDLELKPREKHFDRRVTVTTPLQKAGAYLVTASLEGGNTAKCVLWVSDTAIIKKPLSTGMYYFVGDAASGKPIEKANLEFFGWKHEAVNPAMPEKFQITTKNFAEFTDADGQFLQKVDEESNQYQWLITATTQTGRLAYLGFTGIWTGGYHDADYEATRVFTITDRPVYRPGQKVHFKFWVRHAKYDEPETSDFANKNFAVEIHNPKGEKVLAKNFVTDAYGGIEGEYELPTDAPLGVYQALVVDHEGGSFRVEEYKKPEYEVTVEAPTEPVMLGEKITATIKAKYLFGAPVVKAKVKYKVQRTNHSSEWFPIGDWDWLYGRGYWWFACDYPWYPGWSDWACRRPIPVWWFQRGEQPPELLIDREVAIGPDGTVKVEIDTALAKAVHADQDHQYSITAEVIDESRRTIVGTGNVLVARKPFKVYAWVDRGYYRIGDTIRTDFFAQTLDQKPVKGTGKLSILKITYDKNRKPIETPVKEVDLETDERGMAAQKFTATLAGQYRLSYKVTDQKKHTIEGGYVFTIIGDGFDGGDFRYNHLELVPNKREFAADETVNLQINTDRLDSTILLFVRPANGAYLKPKVIRMKGKSLVEEIKVVKKDMPNFFVEAVTLSGAKVHTEVKELIVPPEKRILNVEVLPSAETYKPGQAAKVKIKLTDFHGKPFSGTTVLTMYDKAVEYISGGSNVADIKDFFWNWRRQHQPQSETSLNQVTHNLDVSSKPGMENLGIFGGTEVDEAGGDLGDGDRAGGNDDLTAYPVAAGGRFGGGGLGGGGLGGGGGLALPAAAPAPERAAANGFALKTKEAAKNFANSDVVNGSEAPSPPAPPAGQGPNVAAAIRTKFADTAFWAGSLSTDQNGLAEIALNMPENLTAWKIKVWGMGHGTKVGQGEAEVKTNKDLIVRLQAPRFFVEKDEVVLSANVHNYLKSAKKVTAQLILGNNNLMPLGVAGKTDKNNAITVEKIIDVPAGGEQRVDWRVSVAREGEAIVRMAALTDEDSDATEQRFPVYVHGMLKTDSYSGVVRPDKNSAAITIKVPAERRINESRLEIRYSPTLAGAMVDALPYMAEYPYGCTEQTLNRFLPTVVTQKVLQKMGLDLKAIRDKQTNLNAQEIGDDKQRAKGWKRFDLNPVFDEEELQKMVKEGVRRLTEMQLSDGGWGWFSGWGEHSSAHTTAVVVHGMQIAQQNDVALVPGMLDRGVAWLKNYQDRQIQLLKNAAKDPKPAGWQWKDKADNLDAFVYMVLVEAGVKSDAMRDFLYRDRVSLAVYAKALLGLALEKQGEKEKLAMILQNISQFVVEDDENQTAYLKLPENNYWWYWYGSEIEADAYYLKLLAKTDPKGERASRLVKYLLNNRKHATYWNSTRDSSLCIEAMADYLQASGENKPDLTLEILIDGKKQKEVKITAADLFTFDNKLVLFGDGVTTGEHKIEFKKKGNGPLYFNAYLTNFSLEDHIAKAGLEIKVNRKIYQLIKADKSVQVAGQRGQALDQKVEKYDRKELADLSKLKSGDLVEVELEIDSKNDYEYILFEDLKGAGFEAVDLRSGYGGNGLNAYMEFRDNRVCFFVANLARGKHSVAYRLRAEIPGKFSALPARASAMYAPELRGNSDEIKLQIED